MRNALPRNGSWKREAAIINLDDEKGRGTHWVAYRKNGPDITYFDSFGNLRPPRDLMLYFGEGSNVKFNHERYQDYNSLNCGHLCLTFLANI